MGFARSLARQLAEPSGFAGALCGAAMDVANRAPMRMAIDLLAPADGEVLLDAGCGTGAATQDIFRRASCRIIAVDQSATMIRRARSRMKTSGRDRVELHHGRLEDLPCPPGMFDAALALNILYFCDEASAMIDAIRTYLRPGGRLVSYVTHRNTMENWAFTREGLHRLYDEHQLGSALMTGGFDPARIRIETRTVAPGIQGLLATAYAT
ncbi:class I SAM-dependent methyltransferase [Sphingobium sp. JS3065]|uniref:class I SAM-dependent methyltransferase n=1 Tax=Sphingobium sp. JS3065 TaxID=2970925 RepID=UPI002264C565|nr:class I SAM-dependent methyltransferase [Sphingobium sp. JS3065]UZW57343.1 class I SAM-dependent methyltransferase [Sphingobium sp. JS3065]